MNVSNGVAEMALGVTGSDVAANVATDPLADKFGVEVYANGECDVCGSAIHVQYHKWPGGGDAVFLFRMPTTKRDGAQMSVTRTQAIELRDALDVLIRNTAKNTGE